MKTRFLLFLSPLLLIASVSAQDYFPHHNFTLGVGAARPRGDLGPLLSDSPAISIGYGYRFHRFFQADAGLDMAFGAASVRDYLDTAIGPLRIKDREYFIPFGGRAIAPFFGGRLLVSGGGGGVYMRYAERLHQPSDYYRIDCPVCTARGGFGYYAQTNVSYFLNTNQNFRVGVTSRVMRGHTSGEPLGDVPGFETKDHWLQILAEFGFSF